MQLQCNLAKARIEVIILSLDFNDSLTVVVKTVQSSNAHLSFSEPQWNLSMGTVSGNLFFYHIIISDKSKFDVRLWPLTA
jgi:hypothetical protein